MTKGMFYFRCLNKQTFLKEQDYWISTKLYTKVAHRLMMCIKENKSGSTYLWGDNLTWRYNCMAIMYEPCKCNSSCQGCNSIQLFTKNFRHLLLLGKIYVILGKLEYVSPTTFQTYHLQPYKNTIFSATVLTWWNVQNEI